MEKTKVPQIEEWPNKTKQKTHTEKKGLHKETNDLHIEKRAHHQEKKSLNKKKSLVFFWEGGISGGQTHILPPTCGHLWVTYNINIQKSSIIIFFLLLVILLMQHSDQ